MDASEKTEGFVFNVRPCFLATPFKIAYKFFVKSL